MCPAPSEVALYISFQAFSEQYNSLIVRHLTYHIPVPKAIKTNIVSCNKSQRCKDQRNLVPVPPKMFRRLTFRRCFAQVVSLREQRFNYGAQLRLKKTTCDLRVQKRGCPTRPIV